MWPLFVTPMPGSRRRIILPARAFEAAARSHKVIPIAAPVHNDAEIETVITSLGSEPPGGGLVQTVREVRLSRPQP